MDYKLTVEKIKSLKWQDLDSQELQQLMWLSCVAAREFAAALRIALKVFPEDGQLQEMAAGELQTDNLAFGGYAQRGDHADFLEFFLHKSNVKPDDRFQECIDRYWKTCDALDAETRAMSIFSREEELPTIFGRVLQAKDWSGAGLDAFKYYLEQHIRIDTGEGGHHDLTKKFPIDDRIAPFYAARLDMYRCIPKLFL